MMATSKIESGRVPGVVSGKGGSVSDAPFPVEALHSSLVERAAGTASVERVAVEAKGCNLMTIWRQSALIRGLRSPHGSDTGKDRSEAGRGDEATDPRYIFARRLACGIDCDRRVVAYESAVAGGGGERGLFRYAIGAGCMGSRSF